MTDTPEVPANDIPAILARADAATPGNWYVERGRESGPHVVANWSRLEPDYRICREVGAPDSKQVANAEFIAHSRTDVPNMAAEILSLRADKKRLDVLEDVARKEKGNG